MYGLGIVTVLCLYIWFAIWVIKKITSKYKKIKIKIFIVIVSILIFFAIPVGDEIVGRIYFNHLCKTEAGVKIYRTIELPSSYWNESGKAKFYNGAINNDVPSNAFKRLGIEINFKMEEADINYSIEKFNTMSIDKETGLTISEIVGFFYWGGWIKRNFFQPSAISCGGANSYDDFVKKQFIPTK